LLSQVIKAKVIYSSPVSFFISTILTLKGIKIKMAKNNFRVKTISKNYLWQKFIILLEDNFVIVSFSTKANKNIRLRKNIMEPGLFALLLKNNFDQDQNKQ
jgi:hypothetical protein